MLAIREKVNISERRALQNLAGRLVMSQLVGLIHPYPIDHLATVLGHDVVQVKDDFRLWALFLGTVPTGGNRL